MLSKLEPLTVNVNAGSPAVFAVGDRLVITGTGWFTVKFNAGVDVPPPGLGFVIVTGMMAPAVVISDAEMEAVNCPELMTVAVWGVAPKFTVAPVTKLLPFTVSGKVGPPAVALAGDNVLVLGTGLLMGRVSGADPPPFTSGSKTVTVRLPAVVISLASMGVLSWVESMNVVVRSRELILITKPSTKPVPLTGSPPIPTHVDWPMPSWVS